MSIYLYTLRKGNSLSLEYTHNGKKYNFPVEAGIISFRNLDNGVIKTTFQDTSTKVTTEKLKGYKQGLSKLISDILEINIPFIEKP